MKQFIKNLFTKESKPLQQVIPNGIELPDGQKTPLPSTNNEFNRNEEYVTENFEERPIYNHHINRNNLNIFQDKNYTILIHGYSYYPEIRWGHSVFQAFCDSAQYVALKIIDYNRYNIREDFWPTVKFKANKWAMLNHPGVVRLIGKSFIVDDRLYLPMEFVDGITLQEYVKSAINEHVKFSMEQVAYIMGQIFDTVEYLHTNNIIHHDINPSNVLICPNGNIKLIGISLEKDYILNINDLNKIKLQPLYELDRYSSPEQIENKLGNHRVVIDNRTDIYSLGRLLYFIITGNNFILTTEQVEQKNQTDRTEHISIIDSDIDSKIEKIILQATDKNINNRYHSAQEFKRALFDALVLDSNKPLKFTTPVKILGTKGYSIPSTNIGKCNTDEVAGYIVNTNSTMSDHTYEAYYKGKTLALRIYQYEWYTNNYENFWTTALHTAEKLANLNHPSIVHIIDKPFLDRVNNLYVPVEYIEGITLKEYVTRITNAGKRLSEQKARSIMLQIIEAIDYLHSNNLTHNDINPENVLICPDGKVCIIGISLINGIIKLKPHNGATHIPMLSVLNNYSSPEQIFFRLFNHNIKVDYHTDIYSLGSLLYYILTGEHAYDEKMANQSRYMYYRENLITKLIGNSNSKIYFTVVNKKFPCTSLNIDNRLKHIIKKATQWRVKDRYNSVQEFKDALLKVSL